MLEAQPEIVSTSPTVESSAEHKSAKAPSEKQFIATGELHGHFLLQNKLDEILNVSTDTPVNSPTLKSEEERIAACRDIIEGTKFLTDFDEVVIKEDSMFGLWKNKDIKSFARDTGYVMSKALKIMGHGFRADHRQLTQGALRMEIGDLHRDSVQQHYYDALSDLTFNERFLELMEASKTVSSRDVHAVILSRNASYFIKGFVALHAEELSSRGIFIDGVIANTVVYKTEEENGQKNEVFDRFAINVTSDNKALLNPGTAQYLVDEEEFEVLGKKVNAVNISYDQSGADLPKAAEIMESSGRRWEMIKILLERIYPQDEVSGKLSTLVRHVLSKAGSVSQEVEAYSEIVKALNSESHKIAFDILMEAHKERRYIDSEIDRTIHLLSRYINAQQDHEQQLRKALPSESLTMKDKLKKILIEVSTR